MTGFEPATTRPPDVDSTGLSYIPNSDANIVRIFIMMHVDAKKNVNIAYGVGFQRIAGRKKRVGWKGLEVQFCFGNFANRYVE